MPMKEPIDSIGIKAKSGYLFIKEGKIPRVLRSSHNFWCELINTRFDTLGFPKRTHKTET